jgi:hydrogenase maturation protein HypF
MAENDVREPVIGVAFDGTGWGSDGAIWGGEFLLTDYADYKRVAHLRYVPLAGGESATRENWRMAAAYLLDADCDLAPLACWSSGDAVRTLRQMIDRRVNCPLTSSAGRLFDAIAALLGVRGKTTFEAQAAMELEWLATDVPIDGSYPFEIAPPADGAGWPMELDLRPTIRAITREVARGIATAQIARRFHSTMVEMIATMCGRLRDASGLRTVALSGGAFANALLAAESEARLTADGFRVLRHSQVPTNDAGLSLGQLAVAAAVLQQKSSPAESAVGSLAPGRMAGTTRLSTFEMVNTP